jgi:hypothetical protein
MAGFRFIVKGTASMEAVMKTASGRIKCGFLAITVGMLFSGVARAEDRQPTPAKPQGFSCNLRGLTQAERAEYQGLIAKLKQSVVEVRELADGFSFRISSQKINLVALSRWVELERHCCAFFRFGIDVEPYEGAIWLRLTGAPGVKAFLKTEMMND